MLKMLDKMKFSPEVVSYIKLILNPEKPSAPPPPPPPPSKFSLIISGTKRYGIYWNGIYGYGIYW